MSTKKEWLISFNDLDLTFENLRDLDVNIGAESKKHISSYLKSANLISRLMPMKLAADIYFRTANQIIRNVEVETGVVFKKYKKCNYEI